MVGVGYQTLRSVPYRTAAWTLTALTVPHILNVAVRIIRVNKADVVQLDQQVHDVM